jgi:phage terminase large subunit-like protein
MPKLAQQRQQSQDDRWIQWIRSESDERAVAAGCRFDLAAAERVRSLFSRLLRHSNGEWAGQPFALMDWQWQEVVAPLFGWIRPDGTRRYRRGYLEVPKKNGKSALFSGLSLYLLLADKEPGAEIYSAAVDRDQASIVFNEAGNMVEASPQLPRGPRRRRRRMRPGARRRSRRSRGLASPCRRRRVSHPTSSC